MLQPVLMLTVPAEVVALGSALTGSALPVYGQAAGESEAQLPVLSAAADSAS